MDKIDKNILDKILKIKRLAEEGTDGEKEAAKRMLEIYLEKYNISLDEILEKSREVKKYKFKYSSKEEKQILVQCIAFLFGSKSEVWNHTFRYLNGKMELVVECTQFEYILLNDFYNFHREQFKQELKKHIEILGKAYIQNQNLFDSDPKEEKEEKNKKKRHFSFQEAMEILAMSENMNVKKYYKALKQ